MGGANDGVTCCIQLKQPLRNLQGNNKYKSLPAEEDQRLGDGVKAFTMSQEHSSRPLHLELLNSA